MRQVGEEVGHPASLEVDNEKTDIFWAEVDGQGKNIGLQSLRLSRPSRSGNQSVRAVKFLVDIKIAVRAAGLTPDQGFHAIIVPVLAPSVQDIEFFHAIDAVHLKEADSRGNLAVGFNLAHTNVGQTAAEVLQLLPADNIGREGAALFPCMSIRL